MDTSGVYFLNPYVSTQKVCLELHNLRLDVHTPSQAAIATLKFPTPYPTWRQNENSRYSSPSSCCNYKATWQVIQLFEIKAAKVYNLTLLSRLAVMSDYYWYGLMRLLCLLRTDDIIYWNGMRAATLSTFWMINRFFGYAYGLLINWWVRLVLFWLIEWVVGWLSSWMTSRLLW